MKLFAFIALFVTAVSWAETTVITITEEGNTITQTTEQVPQQKLRSQFLKKLVNETTKKAIALEWDEGNRVFLGIDDTPADQYNIVKKKLVNKEVRHMEVIVNGKYGAGSDQGEWDGVYKCKVDLERYEPGDDFLSEYAYCTVDGGEELEYEE